MSSDQEFSVQLSGDPCFDALNLLYHYLDGELTELHRVTISGHIEFCGSCLSAYDFHAELRTVVRTRSVNRVPDELRSRIARELGFE